MPLSGEQQGVVRLDVLVREIVEFVSVVAEADGVRIECAELPELEINGRREDLATLINNLINNAIRFAAQGEKIHTVFISGVRRFNTLSLTIADTGPGMTSAEREHAFEPLFRGAGATPGTGMGLGLAIAKHVVETHRGTIAFSERPGGGEQVTVNFPTGGVDQK
jgi:signal transduction histidine kinase